MPVDQDTVRKIAHLARIAVTDDEAVHLEGELNAILKWVEQLAEIDTEGVEPMTSAVSTTLKMREDKVTDGGYAEKITVNAPETEDNYFQVPKVVD